MDADTGQNILADNANWLRTREGWRAAGRDRGTSPSSAAATEAALAWYRARGVRHQPVGPTRVPTLFIWAVGRQVGRAAAEGQASSSRCHASSPLWPVSPLHAGAAFDSRTAHAVEWRGRCHVARRRPF